MPHRDNTNDDSSRTSRRTFLKSSGAAGAACVAGLSGCIGGFGGGGGKPTINMIVWDEYATPKLVKKLESEFDVKIKTTKSTSSSAMFTAWNSGKDELYDIAIPNNNYVPKFMKAGLIAPVPMEKITHWEAMYETFKKFAQTQFSKNGKLYGVPLRFGWYAYSYDGKEVPDHEQSYDILFDPMYTGKDMTGNIIMYDDHFKAMSATALYLGYRDAFNGEKVTLTKAQVEKVKQTMIDQKEIIQGYIAADPTFIKNMKQDNFDVGQSARNELVAMWDEGIDWPTMATPKEGSLAWFEAGVVSKKSQHKDLAWDIINAFISPKIGATLAQVGFSPIVNPKTQKYLTEKQNEMYGAIPPKKLNGMIPFKAVENEKAWIKAWEEIKAA